MRGAITEMMAATLRPMNNGVVPDDGRATFRSRVSTQMRNASIAVPVNSARKAESGPTTRHASSAVPKMDGLGKYSPKTIADSSLPGPPRSRPRLRSNSTMASANMP